MLHTVWTGDDHPLFLHNSERWKVPLAWISGNPLLEHCMCDVQGDQFAFSGSGFKTGQGVSGDSMLVMLGMEAIQLHSPSTPQV